MQHQVHAFWSPKGTVTSPYECFCCVQLRWEAREERQPQGGHELGRGARKIARRQCRATNISGSAPIQQISRAMQGPDRLGRCGKKRLKLRRLIKPISTFVRAAPRFLGVRDSVRRQLQEPGAVRGGGGGEGSPHGSEGEAAWAGALVHHDLCALKWRCFFCCSTGTT